ncbi:hypothetical protein Acy02nite_82040 [Actinoplanes cyaneus]|uniref:Uncharacterized protein n=1 Tax=Actinoplanes cyaneus TaxID=52696 RepID=A0A919IRX4_9ACTN|nr:hypothetical protein Acy02nite_82040 [Actinoplanes cyaneus]
MSREQELEPNTVYGCRWLFGLIYPYVGGVRAGRLTPGWSSVPIGSWKAAVAPLPPCGR